MVKLVNGYHGVKTAAGLEYLCLFRNGKKRIQVCAQPVIADVLDAGNGLFIVADVKPALFQQLDKLLRRLVMFWEWYCMP